MTRLDCFAILLIASAVLAAGCRKETPAAPPSAAVAVGNSYLEAAAFDLLGDKTPVIRLAEPGLCPGHFDVRPSQVQELRSARVLLRFDFQKSLDARLAGLCENLRIVEVRIPGGLCEPESYLAACRQTADALVAAGLAPKPLADHKLQWIARRLDETSARARAQIQKAKLAGAAVLTSPHQQAFCKWLGLEVVATFAGEDTAGITQLDQAIRQGEQAHVNYVIANEPEGRRVADALARRLGAKVVVLGNFPTCNGEGSAFDRLVESNVEALVKAAGQ